MSINTFLNCSFMCTRISSDKFLAMKASPIIKPSVTRFMSTVSAVLSSFRIPACLLYGYQFSRHDKSRRDECVLGKHGDDKQTVVMKCFDTQPAESSSASIALITCYKDFVIFYEEICMILISKVHRLTCALVWDESRPLCHQ